MFQKKNLTLLFLLTSFIAIGLFYYKQRQVNHAVSVKPDVLPLFDQVQSENLNKKAPGARTPASTQEVKKSDSPLEAQRGPQKTFRWSEDVVKRRKQLKDELEQSPGRSFKAGRVNFKFSDDLYAIDEKNLTDETGLEVVDRRDGFAYFRVLENGELPEKSFSVALDKSSGLLVVVTGRLKVKFNDPEDFSPLGNQFQLQLVSSFAHLNLAFFESSKSSSNDLVQLLESVRKDSRVVRADLEILGPRAVPQ